MEYYQTVSDQATEHLPIADIHNVEGQDASIAIYHTAPLRLEKTQGVDAPSLLKNYIKTEKERWSAGMSSSENVATCGNGCTKNNNSYEQTSYLPFSYHFLHRNHPHLQ